MADLRTILAYGDSLTWGSRPDISARHAFEDRWPNVLAAGLRDCHVISEGLRGRTTCFDQPTSPAIMNGGAMLPSILHSHAPLDVVIIMLGSNDMFWSVQPTHAVKGLERLVEIIRHHPWRSDQADTPQVLLVAPPPITTSEMGDTTQAMIDAAHAYAGLVQGAAERLGCGYFDAGSVAEASPLDGIHLDATSTRAIGAALIPVVTALLENN